MTHHTLKRATPMQRALPVVAAVIEDASQRVLLAQRPPGGAEALRWEFPGGKVHRGERLEAALRRELIEELDWEFVDCTALTSVRWRGPPRPLNLHAFRVRANASPISARQHLALAWATRAELVGYDVPAPDRPIVARLALPSRYLVTADATVDLDSFLQQLQRALVHHAPGVMVLRVPALAPAQLPRWAAAVLACVRVHAPATLAFLHSAPALAMELGYDGVHLSAAALAQSPERPVPRNRWLLASTHTRADLRLAEALGVDAVVLGAVNPTATHPHARTLGWRRFCELARSTWLPVYALGGVGLDDLDQARAHGAHGIAAIRAFWGMSPG